MFQQLNPAMVSCVALVSLFDEFQSKRRMEQVAEVRKFRMGHGCFLDGGFSAQSGRSPSMSALLDAGFQEGAEPKS